MDCKAWELASWVATTLGFIATALGLLFVVVQLLQQSKQNRLDALNALYAQLDTHAARLAREFIYASTPERLRFDWLHSPDGKPDREIVEETLATLERMAYPIATGQLPSDDAFNLYGGVLLSISHKLWDYVEEQRTIRKNTPGLHKLGYRRYLEETVRQWAPKYAGLMGLPAPSSDMSTKEMLRQVLYMQEHS